MKTIAILLGALATTTAATAATAATYEDFARVISVQEQYRSNSGSRQVCDNNQQQQQGNSVGAGTAIGAVTVGLLGAQVGKGNGKVAASAAGAVVGALSGNYIENNNRQPTNGGSRCYYPDGDSKPSGYRVTYEYMGRTYTDNFSNPPNGDEIKVRVTIAPSSYR